MPPNTQGFVALEMLNILEGFDLRGMGHNTADYLHVYAEAKRIAFADRGAYLADPRDVPQELLSILISKSYAGQRRREIDMRRAADHYMPCGPATFDSRAKGDTVYLAAADRFGNAISLINSLFDSFGSGIIAPGTGVALHSRGSGFSLDRGHPNELAPGKRPFHTLVPAFLMKDGAPFMAFGVMGADNQAQAHAQVVANIVDFDMNVQEAGEVPRVRHFEEGLAIESGVSREVCEDLRRRGHVLHDGRGMVGGHQAVQIDTATGVLRGGSDPRKDGLAIGF
jgi:gamma-glutamyltranspeptidase/glutathione hydrolase